MTPSKQQSLGEKVFANEKVDRESAAQLADLNRLPKATILVHERHDENEPEDVLVGVNGVMFQLQRGVEVEVPLPVAMVLEDNKRTMYEFKRDREGRTVEMTERQVPPYPFAWIKGRPAHLSEAKPSGGM